MTKDVTVSKLSKLQKRILVYARQRMLAKDQKIEAPTQVTVCMRAPPWLDKALSKAMSAITKSRQGYVLWSGPDAVYLGGLHPWMRLFAEMTFLREQIDDAAKEAGVQDRIDLARLDELASPSRPRMLTGTTKVIYHSWPYIDGRGWYFKVNIEGVSLDEVKAKLLKDDLPGVWAFDNSGGLANCTIPELLRDLFGFSVQEGGHIEALAFSVDEIGARRYNAAQASLRRACTRLQARGLIETWSGQRATLSIFNSDYERTGIGLTEAGVAVADALIQAEAQAAQADLGLRIESDALADA